MQNTASKLQPVPAIQGLRAYSVLRHPAPVDLRLDGNEGAQPPKELLDSLAAMTPDALRSYPAKTGLTAALAAHFGLRPGQVLVTAGADDALERACRSVLGPGKECILPSPTFEMLGRYTRLAGAEVKTVPWTNPEYPLEGVLQVIGPRTAAIAVVSPNNPTGATITPAALRSLAAAAPHALIIVDLAYIEFADVDLTCTALELPNAVVIRTFSKAWGLAGLRVGYALGPEEIISWMDAAGNPYTVSGPSLVLAKSRFENGRNGMLAFVETVRTERAALEMLLSTLGAHPMPSQGNFVFYAFENKMWVWQALASLGIAVRHFGNAPGLSSALRITCPGNSGDFLRLERALKTSLAPEALFVEFDKEIASAELRDTLFRLGKKLPLIAVTSGSKAVLGAALSTSGFAGLFRGIAAPLPGTGEVAELRLDEVLTEHGLERAWLLARTPAAIQAARRTEIVSLVVDGSYPGTNINEESVLRLGVARVLTNPAELEELLP